MNDGLPTEKIDAVVVGSGAAGSTIAAKLAAGGKQVLILEAGPEHSSASMISSTLWARRLKWNGPPVAEAGANPVGHVFNAGYGTGGAALHHYAVWPRLHAEDFAMQSRYDRGHDWPIDYQEIAPYYDLVQAEAGVAGDADQEIWRPDGAPYPLPPVPRFAQGDTIAAGFETLGMQVAPLPLAVTTREFNGRPPCIWDGWCDAGCPIGALANPLTVYLPMARQAGARLVHETPVTRVLTDASGKRATGVEIAAADGTKRQVHADLVVLAAFAIENPRILYASATDQHAQGIGNGSDMLGRYIMSHAAGLIYGLFDEPTQHYQGAFGGQLLNQDGYAKDTHAAHSAFGSYQWMIAQAVKPNDLLGIATTRGDLFGDELHRFMRRASDGFATMTAVIEDLPVADNRVTQTSDVDDNGVPLAQVTHTTHPESVALWHAVLKEGRAIFEAAGAEEVWTGPPGPMHIMGGTVMGNDPATSVTNAYGQVHEFANLVIAGPGLFPTSSGVNPTFTVHALAARSAAYLLENWSNVVH